MNIITEEPLPTVVTYVVGEKILAYHQSLIYEAKVNDIQTTSDGINPPKETYFIHYNGWNERWDEWVDPSRIMKFTEENKKIADNMRAELRELIARKREGKGKKRKHPDNSENNLKLDLSQEIRKVLLDDSEYIANKQILTLPKPVDLSISKILESFLIETTSVITDPSTISSITDVVNGVQMYFDKSLGTLLLYRFERLQYSKTSKYENFRYLWY
eukprot:TRINITY_DN1934_c0_g1_i2.p1 TRINITY_DN1934_c0_g1~~TRINITY_DN1934_c0_g1_i2.p1  ORF type:complete len:216 (-),score=27.12 TRINITY_DN1934_c0_g1_i2:376-1023(-)